MLILALLACKGDDPVAVGTAVVVDPDRPGFALVHDGATRLDFGPDGVQLGLVSALDDSKSYDPFWPDAVAYASMTSLTEAGPQTFEAEFDGGATATLTFEDSGDGRVALSIVPSADALSAYVRLSPTVDPTEGFYGLGETFDRPEHRGTVRPMQIEFDALLESANTETHVPVPLLIGTNGWGLFVEDRHPGLFDVASVADDRVTVTYGIGMDAADGLRVHLYAADAAVDVTGLYYQDTVAPRLPAPWAYGPLVWRDENESQAQFENDLETLRELDLATSGVWIDRPYASGVNSFDFDPVKFPTAQVAIDHAHALGMRVALWHVPYVSADEVPELDAIAEQSGFYPPDTAPLLLNGWGPPIDFSNPDAADWWVEQLGAYQAMGIEGYKLDYAEDIVLGANGSRLAWTFADGSDERTMHAEYPMLYHQTYGRVLPDDGGFLLCRAGTWGDQANARIIWPGDLDATMDPLGTRVTEDSETYVAVGGLPSAVSAAMGLGPSGFPFFASDTGGYRHSPPDKETFVRWFEHTALSASMQIGTSSNDVAWEFDEDNGFDEESLSWYRDYVRLHLRLFPYVWTHAERLDDGGRAILRPVGLVYPEVGHPADEYLVGDDLLVAPVIVAGATSREVAFPAGRWIDWFDGTEIEGGSTSTVDAPLERLPLYVRAGGIVPMLRPTIDTLSPTTEPERVDSYANDAGVLWVRIYPSSTLSIFPMWDGTTFSVQGARITASSGSVFDQGAVLEILGQDAPGAIEIDGTPLGSAALDDVQTGGDGWAYDATLRAVWVTVPAGGHEVALR